MDKLFIKSEDLISDAFKLAWKVFESGYQPNYIVGVWRGGAPIGIAVRELLSVWAYRLIILLFELHITRALIKRKERYQYMVLIM